MHLTFYHSVYLPNLVNQIISHTSECWWFPLILMYKVFHLETVFCTRRTWGNRAQLTKVEGIARRCHSTHTSRVVQLCILCTNPQVSIFSHIIFSCFLPPFVKYLVYCYISRLYFFKYLNLEIFCRCNTSVGNQFMLFTLRFTYIDLKLQVSLYIRIILWNC